MTISNKITNLSLAASLGFASMLAIPTPAMADDPVLLKQLDQVTDQNLQSENAQIQAAKAKNTAKK